MFGYAYVLRQVYGVENVTHSIYLHRRVKNWFKEVYTRCRGESNAHITTGKSDNEDCWSAGGYVLKVSDSGILLTSIGASREFMNDKTLTPQALWTSSVCCVKTMACNQDSFAQYLVRSLQRALDLVRRSGMQRRDMRPF